MASAPMSSDVERSYWILGLVIAGLIASFGDALLPALFKRLGIPVNRPDPLPEGLLELMARDLASGEPAKVERATAALLHIPGAAPVPYLTGLLRHQRPEVARQAAYILYERQDADGLTPLYQYLASVRS